MVLEQSQVELEELVVQAAAQALEVQAVLEAQEVLAVQAVQEVLEEMRVQAVQPALAVQEDKVVLAALAVPAEQVVQAALVVQQVLEVQAAVAAEVAAAVLLDIWIVKDIIYLDFLGFLVQVAVVALVKLLVPAVLRATVFKMLTLVKRALAVLHMEAAEVVDLFLQHNKHMVLQVTSQVQPPLTLFHATEEAAPVATTPQPVKQAVKRLRELFKRSYHI
jgi:hypothetical protein